MNKRPLGPEGNTDKRTDGSSRGQSDVLALVILFGMIFVGAAAVIIAGGYLVDSVQGESQHELAKDSALQTHQSITEALESGEARDLGVGDDVDVSVLESGSIAIEMTNSSGGACSANGDVAADRVEADLGAIVYDTPRGEIVYQGGAIWERTDAGLSTVRAPPISYGEDTARISIQTVSADADSFEGQMARPNETMQTEMAEETNRLLTRCPADGYTNLAITLESPNYAERWESHFEERVNTSDNVDVTRSGDTVVANISNATSAHASRGLRFENISAPTIIDPVGGNFSNEFYLDAEVANDGFVEENATVELQIDGVGAANHTAAPASITPGNAEWVNFSTSANGFSLSSFQYSDLVSSPDLETNQIHRYRVRLYDGSGTLVSESNGKFFLASSGSRGLYLAGAEETLGPDHNDLAVNATLVNTGSTDETTDVTFDITDDRVDMDPETVSDVEVSSHGGISDVGFRVNVSELRAGTYEYQIEAAGETITRTFTVTKRNEGSLVDQIRVESVEPGKDYLEQGEDEFNVTLQLRNVGDLETNGDIELDIASLAPRSRSVDNFQPGETTNVTLSVPESQVATLEAGKLHNYDVILVENGEEFNTSGSFYLGTSGPDPVLESVSHTSSGDDVTINATIGNRGLENVTRDVNMTLRNSDGLVLGSDNVTVTDLAPGWSQNARFSFNASNLAGEYNYTIEFGEEYKTNPIAFDGVSGGDDEVSVNAPGNGTVTVLGTEVSGESTSPPWEKSWAPVGATVIEERNGVVDEHPFYNTETELDLEESRNLNTYDTQYEQWEWNWEQNAGETVNLTLSSTLWTHTGILCSPPYDSGEEHNRTGPGYDGPRTYEDYHPDDDYYQDAGFFCNYEERTVDATTGEHPENVQVLTDGQELPDITRGFPDQRNASQVLNDGAAHRIDPDSGELQLNSNEAVFLFELTEPDATWLEAQNADPNEDPTYNDVIALLEFTPADTDQNVTIDVDGGDSVSITIGDPGATPDDGTQNISDTNSSVDEDGDGEPAPPEPESPDPGDPSAPDEVDVDVGGVVIG